MSLNHWFNRWLEGIRQEIDRGQRVPPSAERIFEDIVTPCILIGLPCLPRICGGRVGDLTFSEPLGWCMLAVAWVSVAIRASLLKCVGSVLLRVKKRSAFSLVWHIGAALVPVLIVAKCMPTYAELSWLLGILLFASLRSARDIGILVEGLVSDEGPRNVESAFVAREGEVPGHTAEV